MAPGVEYRGSVRDRALAPFRAGLRAAADAALGRRSWTRALPFLIGDEYPRSMYDRGSERPALVALLTDAGRYAAADAVRADRAAEQVDAAARHVAGTAASVDDLEDLAALLVAASRARPADGAPPHGIAPIFAFAGDLDRAVQIAELVRVDPQIELAYVGEAAVRAGVSGGVAVAESAGRAVLDSGAPASALLRTAQAVAGAALHAPAWPDSERLSALAVQLVAAASAHEEPIAEVARLSQRLFAASRDHERALSATTLATTAAAIGRAGDPSAAIAEAMRFAEEIGVAGHRARTFARIACRLRVGWPGGPGWRGEPGGRGSGAMPGADACATAADRAAARALTEAPDDPAVLADVALLLAAGSGPTGVEPDRPSVSDPARTEPAATRALELIAARGVPSPRGALPRAVAALGARSSEASVAASITAAARAVLERVAASRHASSLERATRARIDAVACTEAASALAAASPGDDALDAARQALALVRRVPAAGRARPLAEIAADLLVCEDDALFTLGLDAADAEADGSAYRWDGGAAELVGDAAVTVLLRGTVHQGAAERVLERTVRALRRHEHPTGLMHLADRFARGGDAPRAVRLARDALAAARTLDPVLRARARAALEAAPAATAAGAAAGATDGLPVRAIARHWVSDGYPLQDLDLLEAAAPASAGRIRALMRADLER